MKPSVQHAEEMNCASREHRDFMLINWTGGNDPRISTRSRMLYSTDIEYRFDEHGGFYARHIPSGIIEYAYASSDHATAAKRAANPIGTARDMIQPIWDQAEFYRSRPWWAESARTRLEGFQAAA